MSQNVSGIYALLSHSLVYNLFQKVVGSSRASKEFVSSYLPVKPYDNVLDIGCGTGEILAFLPTKINYYGLDLSDAYIHSARIKYKERHAKFYCHDLTCNLPKYLPHADIVLAMGLLHHLCDYEVIAILNQVRKILKDDGLLVTIDPCFVKKQSFISRWIVSRDRGQNVRWLEEYKILVESVFKDVELIHRNDLLNIPYDHAITLSR